MAIPLLVALLVAGPALAQDGPPRRSSQRRPSNDRVLDTSNLHEGRSLTGIESLTVYDDEGTELPLAEVLSGSDTVLVRGCLTCPVFLRVYSEIEALARDYAPKGVRFRYLYGSLAHPENNGYVQPFAL